MSVAAMNSALEFVERICGDLCNAEYNPCEARDIADTLRAAIEAAQTVAKCDHIPVTTFGGDFCIKCNEPMDSNEYPKPAPDGMVLVPVDAIEQIEQWANAYPVDLFPEVTEREWKTARWALDGCHVTLDRISASNMRHVITKVKAMLAAPKEMK